MPPTKLNRRTGPFNGMSLTPAHMGSNPRLYIAKLLIHWRIDLRQGPKRSRMAWPQRKTAIDRVGQELSLWDKGRSVKPTSAAWGVPVHVKNPSVKQALELVHHILPERTFSEENQAVAMKHESHLLS